MRFAYLFLVHKMTKALETTIGLIDDSRNDIFIHVDAKVRDFPTDQVRALARKSAVYFVENRICVSWGGYESIQAELELLKTATAIHAYDYYHLLSGEDMPLKSQEQIHRFFQANAGKEFVQFYSEVFELEGRVRFYHLFSKSFRSKNTILSIPKKAINKTGLFLQDRLGVYRNRDVQFQKGANWFSITNELARYVISQEDWIRKVFHHTMCCDEVFLQTLCLNSPFRQRLYHPAFDDSPYANMRLIMWRPEDCSPGVFTISNKEQLLQSDLLFARKFCDHVDTQIIQALADHIQET